MNKFTIKKCIVAATFFAVASSANAVGIFANSGFEAAGAGDLAANWIEGNQGYSRVCGGAGHGSDCAMQLMSPQVAAAIGLQNSVDNGGLTLVAGSNPLLSFWAKGFAGTTGNANYALRYLDGTGTIMSNSGPQFFQGLINPTTWTELTFDLGAVPLGASAAFIEIVQGIGPIGTGPAGENWLAGEIFIDDVNLTTSAVPVPAAAWLFGSALLGLGGVARRRKAA